MKTSSVRFFFMGKHPPVFDEHSLPKTGGGEVALRATTARGGGPFADELAALVLAGVKTATASPLIAYETEGEPLPREGGYSVILYDDGQAAAVIRDTRVSLVPFDEVSPEHAFREGEGERTLAQWREIHRRAFAPDYRAAGREFDEHGICVLEEFELVYRPGGE